MKIVDKKFEDSFLSVFNPMIDGLKESINSAVVFKEEGSSETYLNFTRHLGPMSGRLEEFEKISSDQDEFSSIVGGQSASAVVTDYIDMIKCCLSGSGAGREIMSYQSYENKQVISESLISMKGLKEGITGNTAAIIIDPINYYNLYPDNSRSLLLEVSGASIYSTDSGVVFIVSDTREMTGTTTNGEAKFSTLFLDNNSVSIFCLEHIGMKLYPLTADDEDADSDIYRMIGRHDYSLKVNGFNYIGSGLKRSAVMNKDNWRKSEK